VAAGLRKAGTRYAVYVSHRFDRGRHHSTHTTGCGASVVLGFPMLSVGERRSRQRPCYSADWICHVCAVLPCHESRDSRLLTFSPADATTSNRRRS